MDDTEEKLTAHTSLGDASPKVQPRYSEVTDIDSDKLMKNGDEDMDEREKEEKALLDEIDYDPNDDAMHIDFNEDQWIPCIPGLSLTMATVMFAIVGAAIGITIALINGPESRLSKTIDTNTTVIEGERFDNSIPYSGDNYQINDVFTINGTTFVDYEIQNSMTTMYTVVEETMSAEWETIIAFPGTLWVNALKLLVLPLIILMMVVLPSRVDEIGFIGKRAVPLYLFTSSCAAIQGTMWAWIIQPGAHGEAPTNLEDRELSDADVTELDAFFNIFYNAIPSNIVTAMADLTILGVIVFFLTIGILLRKPQVKEQERNVVLNFSRAILRCCMMAVVWVIWCTPIGMGSLVCTKIATTENLGDLLGALGWYVFCVLIGHSLHVFVFYPLTFFATTRGNGWLWFSKIYEAPLLAFATSSSAATLPRSLTVADKAGVRRSTYQFILPLGAAINMDGTALGFPIMIGLIAQLHGIDLDFGTVLVVMILSVVVSVGTAPIPNAGMVYLTMLFEAAGMGDLAGEGLATLFVLDWFVDRIETAVNVTSDQFVAKIIDDVSLNAEKQNVKVSCGCCLGPGVKLEKSSNGGYTTTSKEDPDQTTV